MVAVAWEVILLDGSISTGRCDLPTMQWCRVQR
jgi:hypothetical protein